MNYLTLLVPLMIFSPALAGEITVAELTALPATDVIILGEVHDNPVHHLNQASAVAAIAPSAMVFEMLLPEQAAKGNADSRQDAAQLAEVLGWEGTGWPEFSTYYPIFTAAPDARIYGGKRAKPEVRRAVNEGGAAVFGQGAAKFALHLTLPLDQQNTREQGQMTAHCDALPESLLSGMVEAQRLRDATLAAAVLQAFEETGGPVVLITGNGHARRDWGVPAMLQAAAPDLRVLSVAQFEIAAWDEPPFEAYVITAAVERDDPCAAFR
jgi:uncharacterized iron-regulated protein